MSNCIPDASAALKLSNACNKRGMFFRGCNEPIKIKYFDSAGTSHEVTKTVGIEVRGKPEIEVRIKESEITKNKNIGKISVEILNKGSSDAQFFNIKILPTEQYSVISNNEEYIGSLESDDSENVDFDIKVYNTQDVNIVPVSLSIEYKDNYNNEYKEDLTVNLTGDTALAQYIQFPTSIPNSLRFGVNQSGPQSVRLDVPNYTAGDLGVYPIY